MALDITRLSGGNTPADGSDPRTFPAIWNSTATALEGLELDDITDVTITSATADDLLQYDGSDWVNVGRAEVSDCVRLVSTDFTTVASVSIEEVFTSEYEFYRILYRGGATASATPLLLEFQEGSTPKTTNYVRFWIETTNLAGPTLNYTTAQSSAVIGRGENVIWGDWLVSKTPTVRPVMLGTTVSGFGSAAHNINFSAFSGDTTVDDDGFTVKVGSGTFSGTIEIYGMRAG